MSDRNKSVHGSGKHQRIETSPSLRSHPTRKELYAMEKSMRDKCPRSDYARAVKKPRHTFLRREIHGEVGVETESLRYKAQ